jgi:hypothetical protein
MGALFWLWIALAEAAPIDAIEASIGDQSVALPFGNVWPHGGVNPAVTLGVEHRWADGERLDVLTPVRAGAHLHPTIGNAARLGTGIAARWTPGIPVLEAGLDVGTHYVFRPRPTLAFDEDTGTYAPSGDPGRPTLVFGFGGAAGVDLEPVAGVPATVLLGYRWFAQTPFLPAVSVGPQSTLSVGVRWDLGSSS